MKVGLYLHNDCLIMDKTTVQILDHLMQDRIDGDYECKKWLGSSKSNISKLGSFRLLGWLATFYYNGGIQAQS